MPNPILKQNYFEIFSLPISTALDLTRLKEKNHELQQQVHPDRFANSNDAEKREAMQITSWVNEAYNTLKSPVLRLQYMLALKGVEMEGETDTAMDGAFLMQQMELREEIADVKNQSDSLDVLDTMSRDLKNQAENLVLSFADFYQQDELVKSREVVRKLQFINKAQKEVSDITEQLEDELI